MNQIYIIIMREFRERVAKKSFIIVTILMPVLMLLLSCLPALVMLYTGPDVITVDVVDNSGVIAKDLKSDDNVTYRIADAPFDSLTAAPSTDAILIIPDNVVDDPSGIAYYTQGPSSLMLEEKISSDIARTIEQRRIDAQQIDNLKEIMDGIHADVSLRTYRLDSEDSNETFSTGLSFALGLGLSLVLYMFLLLYGQMVMTSIIEEKNNRVLELIVTSVKPMHLMLGKILGIAAVAVVQILIWMVLLCCITAFVLPATLPTEMLTEATAMQAGTLSPDSANYDAELLTVISTLGSVSYILNLLFVMLLFLVGGFLLYAAINAAVGSAVDNIQDASQLQTIIMVPIILGLVMAVSVANNPTSAIGAVCSYIPFTAPMVMMARIPFGVPAWEIALSFIVLMLSFIGTVWLAGRIYRVGIFMYGKKPTFKDLWRWSRQS